MFKNTIFLYLRMFVIMCINLIAVRLLLKSLGEVDYGLFNVVGGIVTLLSFISSSMSSAAQRFYAYFIGRNEQDQLNKVFRVSLFTFIIIVCVSVLIAELAGMWLLYNKMTIPNDRMYAAILVFHFSVVSFSFNMMLVPFMAMVLSIERMDFFSVVSMVESFLKLFIIFLLAKTQHDKLIVYAALYTLIIVLNFFAYVVFIKKEQKFLSFFPKWDKIYFNQLFSYCSWYMYGAIATVVRSQGINILLNMFFNPVVNAARGLAYQVNSAVNAFVNSFFSAVRPQVVKRFAANEMESLRLLVMKSTSLSYYLILVISIPLLVWMPEVLGLWLNEIPKYTVLFTRLVIITSMVETIAIPITTAICAGGNIKWFQLITGTMVLMNLPISYVFLKLGFQPEITMIVAIFVSVVVLFVKLSFAKFKLGFDLCEFSKMLFKFLYITIIGLILPCLLCTLTKEMGLLRLLLYALSTVLYLGILIYLLGLNKADRLFVMSLLKKAK